MGNPQTIPMYNPQGTLIDVPQEQLAELVKGGGMPAVKVQTPEKNSDGSAVVRYIPANQMSEIAKTPGVKILPFEDQDVKHPGFWSTLYDDVSGMATPKNAAMVAAGPLGLMYQAGSKAYEAGKAALTGTKTAAETQEAQEKTAGYSLPYRLASSANQAVGVNVAGMEQSAARGDVSGVMGHAAAVPTVTAATMGAAEAAPFATRLAANLSDTAQAAAAKISSGTATSIPGRALMTAGKMAVNMASDIPVVRQLGKIGKTWASTAPDTQPIYPGAPLPEHPGTFPGAPLPEMPAPEQMAESVAAPRSMNLEAPRTLSGESTLRQILDAQDNANLLKIARSRGINVTAESQLKAGVANPRIAEKIIDDFSDDELDNVRSTSIENRRNPADFSGVEAQYRAQGLKGQGLADRMQEFWNTKALQTYFPDVKIPQTALNRIQAATGAAQGSGGTVKSTSSGPGADLSGDLMGILQDSLKAAQRQKAGLQ